MLKMLGEHVVCLIYIRLTSTGLDWKTRPHWIAWNGLGQTRFDQTGLNKTRMDRMDGTGLVRTGLNRTRPN